MSLFKTVVAYRISPKWVAPSLEALNEALASKVFTPCGPAQQESVGWVPPRGEDYAPLVENIAQQLILKLSIERKSVPASAVAAALAERCKEIEATTGRKPGRKEKKELKEDIALALLPRAFSKQASHFVWVDPSNRLVVVGAGSHNAADHVINSLIEATAIAGSLMPVTALSTNVAPSTAMADWLTTQEAPAGFSVDRDLELRAVDESKSSVRYARHNLELAEIVEHITKGKVPTQLALTWDSRVSFALTTDLVIKKIEILDVVTDEGAEGFDGDVAITTAELIKLIPDLLTALGGELVFSED